MADIPVTIPHIAHDVRVGRGKHSDYFSFLFLKKLNDCCFLESDRALSLSLRLSMDGLIPIYLPMTYSESVRCVGATVERIATNIIGALSYAGLMWPLFFFSV